MARAQTSATGSIRGQVSNESTKQNLQGVTVLVKETGRQVLTEEGGNYTIGGLEPGTYTLVFDYPGLDVKEQRVTVFSSGTARQDMVMGSDIYVMSEFVVASEREGNAAAIAAQRNATNVQNIITADAFGNMAKSNVGNFLKRLPGLAATTDEVESENIVLRGMPAEFTALDIDGARGTSGGSGRSQSAAAIPADMIEKVEVVKALTPDMDADSLGGRINLVTKSAYDRSGRAINIRAATSYSFTYGEDVGRKRSSAQAPSFAVNYSDVFSILGGENNFGIYARANWERILDVRGTTSWGDNDTTVGGVVYPRFNNVSTALHGVDRSGASLRADYKLSPQLSLGSSISYDRYVNDMYRIRNRLRSGTVRPALSQNPYLIVVDGASYGTEAGTRHQVNDTLSGRLSANYKNDSDWRVKAEFFVSQTDREQDSSTQTYISNRKIDYALDRRDGLADVRWPTIGVIRGFYTGTTSTTTSLPSSYLSVNPFSDDFSDARMESDANWQKIWQENSQVTSKVDASKRFSSRWPVTLKSGLSYVSKQSHQWRDDLRGRINVTGSGFGPNLSSLTDPTWDLGGAIGRYPVGYVMDPYVVGRTLGISHLGGGPNTDPINRWSYDPRLFTISNSATREQTLRNARSIWENVGATYFSGEVEIGRLNVLTGIRYERTDVERDQPSRRRQAPFGGTIDEWTLREKSSGDYDNIFPSLHLAYRIIPKKLQLKGAFSTSAGKPDWGSILGIEDINFSNNTISVPNLELKPRYSKNYDLSLEYYFEPVGQITVGVFRKEISDFDGDVREPLTDEQALAYGVPQSEIDGLPWRLDSKRNIGKGVVDGIEFNYAQQLSNILPGALRGMGIFANYTYLSTVGTFDLGIRDNPQPEERNRLEKFIPRTANAGLSYVYNRFDLRLSWNYTSAWDEGTSTNVAETKVRGARWQLDFAGKYQVSKNISIFLDLVNLTSNYGLKYDGYQEPELRRETNALGFLGTGGVQLSF
jgi:TonB-dependent receptor